MKLFLKPFLFLALILVILSGCAKNDDFTIPNIDCKDPGLEDTKTVLEIYAEATEKPVKYTGNDIISGYVVSSDKEKHFYQTIYLVTKDNSLAFKVAAESTGLGHYTTSSVGKHVFIKLENLYIQKRDGILQIGELYNGNVGNIGKALIKNHIVPSCNVVGENLLVNDISLEEAISSDKYVGKLVEFSNVQFADNAVGKPYNDESANATNRDIVDKTGKTIIFRTNKQAPFSSNLISKQSGKIRGIVTKFGTTFQFVARYESDVQLTENRFTIGEPGEPGEPGEEPEVTGVVAFPGADFENWETFLGSLQEFNGEKIKKDYMSQAMGLGMKTSNALAVKGTPVGNDFMFTAENIKNVPTGASKISFYVKGSSAKSISVNVFKADGTYAPFNVEGLNSTKTLDKAENNQYNGTINTNNNWVKVSLNLTGVDYNTSAKGKLIAFKVGKEAAYDLLIDNIMIEGGTNGGNPDPEPEPEPGNGNIAFPGGDFENWTAFENGLLSLNGAAKLKDYATQQNGKGIDGSAALGLIGTPAGNDYVFTTEKVLNVPAGATKLSFFVKGTSAKSLSFNVYKSDGTAFTAFNVGDLGAAAVTISSAANNQYVGVINTNNQWVKVTLNIAGLDYNKTGLKSFLALKVGKEAAYNLYLDNFIIE
ncbi:DUF5689 domain-containing protein [Flavobacterium sp. NKUCC04_CG]|uniref:DUF5689 domain-containing protein n=1 Tax=Flavobacterium sp. NKUCC04_CG TaxID=2842121 RepID=UPI001C5ABE1C|nr:DUF5689 domain-containing protein [Flavobacterium sp. NKUCC04_CG]MBW3518776.1 hypothetical protein [Flavobacterium sp. NKUCC04_CG]